MSEPIIHINKTIITAEQASLGFTLISAGFDYAFVQTDEPDRVLAIPAQTDLKIEGVKFDALDFLKFREGFLKLSPPWNYFLVINGLHGIVCEGQSAAHIEFLKMPEADWSDLLPQIKDMLVACKSQLLKKPVKP